MPSIQHRNNNLLDILAPDMIRNGYQYMHEPIGDFGIWNGQFQLGGDPFPEGWEVYSMTGTAYWSREANGVAGKYCLRGGATGAAVGPTMCTLRYMPVDEDNDYDIECKARGLTGNSRYSMGALCYDSAKAYLGTVWALANDMPGVVWARQVKTIGPAGDVAWIKNTAYARPCWALQNDPTLGNEWIEIDDCRFLHSIIKSIIAVAAGWTHVGAIVHTTVPGDNVGIGDNAPGHKLDVNGDINIHAGSGLMINDAAANRHVLIGDGTRGVFRALVAADLPTIGSHWTRVGTDLYPTNIADHVGVGIVPVTNFHVYEDNADTEPTVRIEQDGAGDAAIRFLLTGGQSWSMGIDNSDSDKWKLSSGGNVNTNTVFTMLIDGRAGFGSTNPATNVEIYENVSTTVPQFSIEQDHATGDAAMRWMLTGGQAYSLGIDVSDASKFKLSTNSGNVGAGTLLTITNAGFLGLNDTAPAHLIDAGGDINIHAGSGLMINDTAANRHVLIGDGTRGVFRTLVAADLPAAGANWTRTGTTLHSTNANDDVIPNGGTGTLGLDADRWDYGYFENLAVTTAIVMDDGGTIGQAAGPLITFDDTNNYLEIMGCDVGIGSANPDNKLDVVGSLRVDYDTGRKLGIYETSWVYRSSYIESVKNDGLAHIWNTKIVSQGADAVGWYGDITFHTSTQTTNAREVVRITGNGDVGINEATPLAQHHIQTSGAAVIGQIIKASAAQTANLSEWRDSAGAVMSVVDKDGNVGIGIEPDAVLHTAKSNARNAFYVDTYDNGISYSVIRIRKSNTDALVPVQTDDGDVLGAIQFRGVDQTPVFDLGAVITATQDGAVITRVPTNLKMETYGPTALNTNQLVLHHDGGIGVNEPAPSARVEINGDVLVKDKIAFTQDDKNEYIDSLADGYMDYRATSAHRFGDGTNQLLISNAGVVTLEGTAKRILTLRPEVNVDEVKKNTVPVQIQRGAFFGYSMPIWNSDHEELFFRESVPGRWDGASDITVHFLVCLAAAEDVNDSFNFQLSWNQASVDEVLPDTTHDTTVETNITDGTQYHLYEVVFTIDYNIDAGDVILAHDLLAFRLRRVAAAGTEIDGEILVLDWHTHYTVDKMFTAA